MSILSATLGLIRALPLPLAVPAARTAVFLYLLASPHARREIGENLHRIFEDGGIGYQDPAGDVKSQMSKVRCTDARRPLPGTQHSTPSVQHSSFRHFWLKQSAQLGENLALMAKIGQPIVDKWLDMTDFVGENILAQIMLRNAPVVVLTLHFGLWELLPRVFVRRGYKVCVGFGGQADRALGVNLSKLRANDAMTWTESIANMRQALRDRRLVGFVLDNTTRTRGIPCDSLGAGFRVLRTPFSLQQSDGAVLVPMFMYRDDGRLRVEIQEPVASADEFGLRARAMIRARPEEWVFWGKRTQ